MGPQPFSGINFDNRGHGVQNANINGKNQYNNNSNGAQYNDCIVNISGNHVDPELEQEEEQKKMDNDILGSLAFPEMLQRREGIQRCHENTCQWILGLEKYNSWMNSSQALMWIKGKPGAGKSTLMSFLYNKFQESQGKSQGIQLEFFFTAGGTALQKTPLGMLRSLLNQLFLNDAAIRPSVRAAYKRRCEKFGSDKCNLKWAKEELEDLLKKAILDSATRQHVTIFVDALDETGEIPAQELAEYLHKLNKSAGRDKVTLKICFSCRHYPIVDSDEATEITVEHHNYEDISSYIKDKFPNRLRDQHVWQKLTNELAKQANGVFQWVHIIMPHIQRKVRHGHCAESIHEWVKEVPEELKEMYLVIMDQITAIEDEQEVFLFFQWICAAERPLTLREMRYALATKNATITSTQPWEQISKFVKSDDDMMRRIKALSGGLAEITSIRGDDVIQVVHQTVDEFLRDKGLIHLRSLAHDGHTSITKPPCNGKEMMLECHATLYQSCLIYLNREVSPRCRGRRGTPVYLEQVSSVSKSYPKCDKVQLIGNRQFLQYATLNLFVHAKKAGRSRTTANLLNCSHFNVIHDEMQTLQAFFSQWLNIHMVLRSSVYDEKYQRGTTLLHMAAAANMVEVIDFLIQNNENINQTNIMGQSAFHLAARWGHTEVAQMLKGRGANDRKSTWDTSGTWGIFGTTPLEEAARYGHVEFVEWLLLEETNTGTRSKKAGNVLQAASSTGQADLVNLLIQNGADVNTQGGQYCNALQAAAFAGSAEVVEMLFDKGADVNAQGGEYGNALQAAAYVGSAEVVEMLLYKRADVNAQGGEYGNALQAAAYARSAEVVEMLLDKGADVNAQGGRYGNALQAAAFNKSVEVVGMLLDKGANVNAQGGEYGSALQAAAFNRSAEVVEMLLNKGANVNAQGGEYGSALQAAASTRSDDVMQILLDKGADVNIQGGHYGNALQAAASMGSVDAVRVLLDEGAGANIQGGQYGSALQAAVSIESAEIVSMLLNDGADANAENAQQATALKGKAKVIEMSQWEGSVSGKEFTKNLLASYYPALDKRPSSLRV
ncbi:NACHT nucleoside triphosphatase [Penicillium vulpinum]|uniref:Nephrocystin 3-like N-terminal domain-containing protein n=1 Tax=Penicillium vulpinum TaxID=29845 RepID=A0A1V6RSD0_9EURO|nr:NACHT nucleoside triphosphatase [Penicillium vulpinum]KAJ5972955.1 NACHT nucleoside triphosphatase [Penicillium vulpinum]OQE04697.1 hypothetical protein PENVUL_c030G09696 [Penicillium vulpinum]